MSETDPADHATGDEDDNTAPAEGEVIKSRFGIERDERMAALEAMPGFRLNGDLATLGRAGHVMYKNAEELGEHAGKFLRHRTMARDTADEYEKELVRYLHNYLTSVYSLIEAQRVVMRHCWGEKSEFELGEYTEHRKASFDTGEAEFMTELRNYCTHRSIPLPGIITKMSWVQGGPTIIENKLTLDRHKLLEWKKWTAPAKAYLNAKDEKFDLGPVLESYVNTASAFFNWFVAEINGRNTEDKSEFLTAAEEYKAWYEEEMGMNTENYRKLFGPPEGVNGNQRRGQRQQPRRRPKSKRRKK